MSFQGSGLPTQTLTHIHPRLPAGSGFSYHQPPGPHAEMQGASRLAPSIYAFAYLSSKARIQAGKLLVAGGLALYQISGLIVSLAGAWGKLNSAFSLLKSRG